VKKTNKYVVLFLILIITVFSGIAGYVFYKNNQIAKTSIPVNAGIVTSTEQGRTYVQFAEGTDIRFREGKLVSLTDADLSQFNNFITEHQINVEKLYQRSEEELSAEHQRSPQLPDKNLAFLLKIPVEEDIRKTVQLLNDFSIVEFSEPVPVVMNP